MTSGSLFRRSCIASQNPVLHLKFNTTIFELFSKYAPCVLSDFFEIHLAAHECLGGPSIHHILLSRAHLLRALMRFDLADFEVG